jgi:hypothetical protein
MAFFAAVPALLSAIGGGSAVAGGLAVAGAVGGVSAAYQQREAGKVENKEYKLQALQERDALRGREIDRKRSLLTALATQNARAGALGVGTGGSIGGQVQSDIDAATMDSLMDRAGTSTKVRVLKTRGANAQKAGNAAAVTSLLDTATDFYKATGGRRKLG